MQTTKLTLEHLSVYLPYSLQVIIDNDGIPRTIYSICETSIETQPSKRGFKHATIGEWCGVIGFKPILKALTTEIEAPQYIRDEISHLANKHMHLSAVSFATIQEMAKNHLDMFSLIDKDLAINYFYTI